MTNDEMERRIRRELTHVWLTLTVLAIAVLLHAMMKDHGGITVKIQEPAMESHALHHPDCGECYKESGE